MDIQQAAEALSLSEKTIRNLLASGRFRRKGKAIDPESVAEFLRERRGPGAQAVVLTHYTINTGHSRASHKKEVSPAVIEQLQTLLVSGRHAMPALPGYHLDVAIEGDCLIATPADAATGRPLATIYVAPTKDSAKVLVPLMESAYREILHATGQVAGEHSAARHFLQPLSPPWCAVYLIAATPPEAYWLGDFERCLAWAWVLRG